MMVENVSPRETFAALSNDKTARLVDVRTSAEWSFVGLPDLGDTGQDPVLVQWQVFPTMGVNGGFVDQLRDAGLTGENKLYFLCRSGVRSVAAAQAAAAAGFGQVFNIADGFEGPPDDEGHRGALAGWKADGLPWRQR